MSSAGVATGDAREMSGRSTGVPIRVCDVVARTPPARAAYAGVTIPACRCAFVRHLLRQDTHDNLFVLGGIPRVTNLLRGVR